jgi:hypothetical protein
MWLGPAANGLRRLCFYLYWSVTMQASSTLKKLALFTSLAYGMFQFSGCKPEKSVGPNNGNGNGNNGGGVGIETNLDTLKLVGDLNAKTMLVIPVSGPDSAKKQRTLTGLVTYENGVEHGIDNDANYPDILDTKFENFENFVLGADKSTHTNTSNKPGTVLATPAAGKGFVIFNNKKYAALLFETNKIITVAPSTAQDGKTVSLQNMLDVTAKVNKMPSGYTGITGTPLKSAIEYRAKY